MILGALLAYPGFADAYFLHLAIATLIPMILASSWDILARTGQVSVGQAALFGIGAYTAVLLYRWVHMPPVLGMLCGAVVATLVSILLGYLTLRLRGIYFSITTIAFAEALTVIWLMVPQVTGGAMGVSAPPLFGGNRVMAYYLVLAILAATVAVVYVIQHSRLNFAFTAIRENEEVASVMGVNPTKYKVLAFMISAVVLAYPAYLGLQYRKLPKIHDITTDPIDPPRFEALARLRGGDGANPAVYAGLYSAEQQRLAYPEIATVELEVAAQRAYDVTLALVNKRKWRVVDERPPQPRRDGRIEAIAQTPIMGFREDVSIRIKPDGEGSRVDIRSSSRYFESDLGSNAARVTKLIEDINSAADQAKPAVKKPQTPAKAQAKNVKKER
ncbi:MAG: DUF1499 domain-containing protein [Bradyrhizobium sp.]|nr:DUF1499 domain-containing protein [Bradyrhizobium sp.]